MKDGGVLRPALRVSAPPSRRRSRRRRPGKSRPGAFAGAAPRADHRGRRRQGGGENGESGRGPLARPVIRACRHPLWTRRSVPRHRSRRGRPSRSRRGRPAGRSPHARLDAGIERRRLGDLPRFGRRFGIAHPARARRFARRQAGADARVAEMRRDDFRDQRRPQAPFGDQGRTARRRRRAGPHCHARNLRCPWRRSGRDRLGSHRRGSFDLCRGVPDSHRLRHQAAAQRRGALSCRCGRDAQARRPAPFRCDLHADRYTAGRARGGRAPGARRSATRMAFRSSISGASSRRPSGCSEP